jgi:cold shock CspA family protein
MNFIEGRIDVYFAKGYGFIHHKSPDNLLTKFFFHISSVIAGEPRNGAKVQFVPVQGKKGLSASNVTVLSPEGK